ncbi:histidine kinase [Nocardia donostiensis]|nr:histidine kinase [Nocardia donostiensis]
MVRMTDTSAAVTQVLDTAPAKPEPSAQHALRTVLRAPIQARTWKELAYLVAVLPLGMIGVTYLYLGTVFSPFAAATIIGIPLVALVVLGGRVWGQVHRALVRSLLDTELAAPPLFRPERGLLGFTKGAFTDLASWRALAFLLVQAVLGVVISYFVLVVAAMTVFTAISPIPWVLLHPTNIDADGVERHSMVQFGDYYFDTWPRVLGFAAIGVVGCFVLPWLIRLTCLIHRWTAASLLTPTNRERMAQLEESRRVAVEDSAATLRKLERDLHDGTQARLVTIAMALGRAEERVAQGGDASELIAQAHAGSKEALVELRELVRGIHPPALELGLQPALETLAARCSLPVELRVYLPERPSPAIEAIAYFSIAELLTNVVKHAEASRAWISVAPSGAGRIAVSVRDDGIGGAPSPGEPVVGSGLSGLAARAATVDGELIVDSPLGGPTVVTLTLPAAGQG